MAYRIWRWTNVGSFQPDCGDCLLWNVGRRQTRSPETGKIFLTRIFFEVQVNFSWKIMRRRILAYFLLGLGFVAVIFFRRYSDQVIPNPYIFYLAGLVIILGAVLLFRSRARTSEPH